MIRPRERERERERLGDGGGGGGGGRQDTYVCTYPEILLEDEPMRRTLCKDECRRIVTTLDRG